MFYVSILACVELKNREYRLIIGKICIFIDSENLKLIFRIDMLWQTVYLERTVELIVAVDLTLPLVFMISRYHYI